VLQEILTINTCSLIEEGPGLRLNVKGPRGTVQRGTMRASSLPNQWEAIKTKKLLNGAFVAFQGLAALERGESKGKRTSKPAHLADPGAQRYKTGRKEEDAGRKRRFLGIVFESDGLKHDKGKIFQVRLQL
jgi:hypothetical protein